MHMADALVSAPVASTMIVASTAAAGYSIYKLKQENNPQKVAVMGVMGAFVFATQMINFTIPGTGSSGHLCGGMLLTGLLGPYAGFVTMIGVLLIQCLLFADGGLLALGCNVWNMAFYGCFLGAIIWKLINKQEFTKPKIILASILGCVLTLQLGAFSVTIETLASNITDLPFSVFVGLMQPIHLAIGFVEGLITSAVLVFVHEARPELLYGNEGNVAGNKFSFKKTIAVLTVCAALIGGGLSLAASEYPDGLEWSIEKITGSTEVESVGTIYDQAAGIQEKTSLLPDYAFKNSDTVLGTSFSGIVGGATVLIVCIGASYVLKLFRKNSVNE